METKFTIRILTVIISITLLFLGCGNRDERLGKSKSVQGNDKTLKKESKKLKKVIYYLENSESMFGYVSGPNEYVSVVSELSEKPEFVDQNIFREFHFINGGLDIKDNLIGTNPSVLKSRLNKPGFRCGDVTKSNLNGMFQIALANAGGENISILISDCIYDIGQPNAPFNALATEGKETRSKFIQRLGRGNMQTIIIKLYSKFKGDYFCTSRNGKIPLDQQRPFYVLIFGESELLNKYFNESYISSLRGYCSLARFLKIDKSNIPYQATNQNSKGTFSFDKANKNKLTDATKDRNGRGFQFSIAIDFSSLPFPDMYLKSKENYKITGNYSIVDIYQPIRKIHEVTSFNPTHMITVSTASSPYGNLELTLKYVIPSWISETDSNTENNIDNDTTHTFGFKYLTDAITEAYKYKNQEQNIATFKFEILK